MKVMCILGSPRANGNSAAIARRFVQTAARHGAEVQTWQLNDLDYRGCQACYGCKTARDQCVIEDDIQPLLEGALDADLLLFASPIYYGEVTGQMKCFIDRTFSWLVPGFQTAEKPGRLPPGKKAVFILTQGYPNEDMFADVFPRYARFLKLLGFADPQLIRACGLHEPDDIDRHPEYLAEAEALARDLVGE